MAEALLPFDGEHINDHPAQTVVFRYRNWRGEIALRTVLPMGWWFGSTEHHPEPQWLMDGLDLQKQAMRTFAVRDMSEWRPLESKEDAPNV